MQTDLKSLCEGSEISGRRYTATPERIQWYGNCVLSASTGQLRVLGSNIHTDGEYAKQQGLPDAVADGMISANLLSTMLVDVFGRYYLEGGELRCKFIKPVLPNEIIAVKGRVEGVKQVNPRSRELTLKVWCEDGAGTLKTEGDARVTIVE